MSLTVGFDFGTSESVSRLEGMSRGLSATVDSPGRAESTTIGEPGAEEEG